jgi:hypothetical protein
MKKRRQSLWLGICGVLIVAGFAFAASQLLPVSAISQLLPPTASEALAQQQQAIPTPAGARTWAPNPQPLPTQANGKPIATPTLIPGTNVKVGMVTQLQQPDLPMAMPLALGVAIRDNSKYLLVARDSTGRYGVHNGTDDYKSYRKLFVHDAQTGQDTQLGNDGGDAYAPAVTDDYVVWIFRCYDACETSPVQSGLYVYDFKKGSNISLGELDRRHDLKADGRWIGYVKATEGLVNPYGRCLGDLYVYNLDTRKEQLVSTKVPWQCGTPKDFYGISNNRVVWSQSDSSAPGGWRLLLRDLTTGETRKLYTPDGWEAPDRVSFSGDYVLWWPHLGYDLKHNTLFNVSTDVPGWGNIQTYGDGPAVVKNDQVYWFKIVDRKTYFFTAPLVRAAAPYPGP